MGFLFTVGGKFACLDKQKYLFRVIIHKMVDAKLLMEILEYSSREDKYPPTVVYDTVPSKDIYDAWKSASIKMEKGKSPFGLYIHIPFCPSKCYFCYCNSVALNSQRIINNYLKCIIRELKAFSPIFKKNQLTSVYIGGGTPSHLSIQQLKALFVQVVKLCRISDSAQLQFDASPVTLTKEKIKLLKSFGVNRITLGVQSFDEEVLKLNNRKNSFDHVYFLTEEIRKAGIKEINIDLIAGLRGQTDESFVNDIRLVKKLSPSMVHVYPLTATAATLFSRDGLYKSKEIIIRRITLAQKMLGNAGFEKIMNDGYGLGESSRNVQETDLIRYNANILGIGNGSQSHIFSHYSYITEPDYKHYMISVVKEKPFYRGTKMNLNREMRWFILHNIREGVSRKIFRQLFVKDIMDVFPNELKYLSEKGLISISEAEIKPLKKEIYADIVNLFFEEQIKREIARKIKAGFILA